MTIEDQPQDSDAMQQTNQENAKGWQTRVEGGTAYIAETIHFSSGDAGGGRQVESIDFQPYLRSILDNKGYCEWQEAYTPTKVEDRKHLPPVTLAESPPPSFSRLLKLRTETVKPPEAENQRTEATDRQEQVEQLDVLAGLRKYAPEHVLLVGKPGSGKSTSLERLLWEEADQALKQNVNAKIPVLVKFRRCTGTIESLIQDFCRSHQLPLTLAEIETLLDQGKLLLLLDGLNELPEAFRTNVANFRDRYRATTPMIVSTRELSIGGNLGIAKTLKMLPLTEPQMQEFVRGYLGQEGNRLWQQLKGDRLRKFAETPLLLWMLCRVFAENDRVPANLGLAFREFTQLYDADLQQDAPAASREQWSKLLRHLAFALMHDRAPTDFRLSMSREEAADLLTTCLQQEGRANARDSAERGLKDLLSYHLIQPVMQPNYEEHIEFRHQLIQEYYAAEYLLRILPTLSDEQLQRDYLNYLKWTEPLSLMLALVEQEALAMRVVRLALAVDRMLGARLSGDVKTQFQSIVFAEVMKLHSSLVCKTRLIELTRLREGFQVLLQFTKSKSFIIRKQAISSLGRVGDLTVVKPLLQNSQLGDEVFISDALIEMGKRIESRAIEKLLIELLPASSIQTRKRIIPLLGNTKSEKVIQTLINLLNSDDKSISWRAVYALGKTNDPIVIPHLIRVLSDRDLKFVARAVLENIYRETENNTAKAALNDFLEQCKEDFRISEDQEQYYVDAKDVEKYRQMIKSKDPNEQRIAIQFFGTLENIEDITIIQDLGLALLDHIPFIRKNAATSLAKIRTTEALKILLSNSYSNDEYTREVIIDSFSHLKDNEIAIDRLKEALSDSSPIIRQKAISLLGHKFLYDMKKPLNQIKPNTSETLESLIENFEKITSAFPKRPVWKSRSSGLVYVVQDNRTLWKYENKMRAWENQVQEIATRLAQIESPKTIQILIKALNSNKYQLRQQVIPALSSVGSEEAMLSIVKCLNDTSSKIRDLAAKCLLKSSRLEFIKHLQELTKKAEYEIVLDTLVAIQAKCKLYNYELAHNLPPQGKSIALYFSSAPNDAELQTQLANHLNLLERQEIITSWHHRQMLPGDERAQVINDRLNSADIILMLISADSISDHTCYDIEINRAMERYQAGEARVIPILLRPVDWQGAPFSRLPVLPKNQQPVTSWSDRDAAFQAIAEGIREVAIELRRTKGARA